MNTSVEKLEPSRVRLTVNITAAEVDQAIDAAYKQIAAKVRIPGFRAGKAPKPMIDTHVGREAVLAEAQDELLNSTYTKAISAENLRPMDQPEIGELDVIEAGKDFEYVAEIEVRPELTLSSVEGLKIEVAPAEATDLEVDAQIEHTRERFATLEPVEDRGVEKDDFVLLSFTGLVEGEAYDGNVVDQYLYELSRGLMPEEFDAAMIGAKTGDQVFAEFVIPDTTSNPDFAGKNAKFTIDIHEIKAKALPPLDDDFASNAGGFDTLEEMRTSVRDQLNHSKAVGRTGQIEQAARSAIAERLVGDVPETLIINTQSDMTREFIGGLESRNINIVDYLQATGVDMDTFEASMREQAEDVARQELALEALFRKQGWEVTDADIDREIATLSGSVDADPTELRRKWEVSGVLELLRAQVMHRRALEWLVDPEHVTIEDVEASTQAAADTEAAADPEAAADAEAAKADSSGEDSDTKE